MVTRDRLGSSIAVRALARSVVALVLLLGAPQLAAGAPTTPIGKWKSIDDASGKAKAIVEIWEHNGKLYGKITKLFRAPGEDQDPKCDKCKGDKKDKRVIGMVIVEGLSKNGDEWSGGSILDPDNGKTYKCKMSLDNGKLKVRGFIGVSLLGRTQHWLPAG
jgi:uncharacterized protein (DUF2147 family)